MTIEECKDIEVLRDLGSQWIKEVRNDLFGLDVDLDVVKADLQHWMDTTEGAVLAAKIEGRIVGLFAVFAVPSYLGHQKVALEKYWYARRGSMFVGPKLYVEAVRWAKAHGCSHLITSGSMTMRKQHDAICRFLEKVGAQHFETSYIYNLRD